MLLHRDRHRCGYRYTCWLSLPEGTPRRPYPDSLNHLQQMLRTCSRRRREKTARRMLDRSLHQTSFGEKHGVNALTHHLETCSEHCWINLRPELAKTDKHGPSRAHVGQFGPILQITPGSISRALLEHCQILSRGSSGGVFWRSSSNMLFETPGARRGTTLHLLQCT